MAKSKFAALLNRLDEMQQSPAYAVARSTLAEAERTIVALESASQEHPDAQEREACAKICDEFATQWARQARQGDNTGASDHMENAAQQIASEIRDSIRDDQLTADELVLLKRIIEEFEDCGETDASHEALMDFARRGYLLCEKFSSTKKALAAMGAGAQDGEGRT